jgi:hypothetical protein
MKMMEGDLLLAKSKIPRTSFSPSPTNFEVSEAAVTLNNVDLASEAKALASNVFPLPTSEIITVKKIIKLGTTKENDHKLYLLVQRIANRL